MAHFPKPYHRPKRDIVVRAGPWPRAQAGQGPRRGVPTLSHADGSPPEAKPKEPDDKSLVVSILAAFLEWASRNRHVRTFEFYRDHLQTFTSSIPPALAVADLKPYHLTRVMDAHSERWSNNGKHNFARAVQRAFSWAERQGLIDHSPVANVEKPAMV